MYSLSLLLFTFHDLNYRYLLNSLDYVLNNESNDIKPKYVIYSNYTIQQRYLKELRPNENKNCIVMSKYKTNIIIKYIKRNI